MTLTRHQRRALRQAQRDCARVPLDARADVYTRVIHAEHARAEAALARAEAKRARKGMQRIAEARGNVARFGAIGNGIADDTQAFQNAITATYQLAHRALADGLLAQPELP